MSDVKCFYIYAKEYSKRLDFALWWRPEARGYTTDLNSAGLFTEAEALENTRGSHGEHVPLEKQWVMESPHSLCVHKEKLFSNNPESEAGK